MVIAARSTREDYYRVLAETLDEKVLVVTALGNASYLWSAIRPAPENFYFEDAMGLALPFALGLAVAQPERQVVVVEGDGGLLMHMGALVSVGAVAPGNLTILLIQNGVHGASGGQDLPTSKLDFSNLAQASGLTRAENIASAKDFQKPMASALNQQGPTFMALNTIADIDVFVPPEPFEPILVKRSFSKAAGVSPYIPTMFGGGIRKR